MRGQGDFQGVRGRVCRTVGISETPDQVISMAYRIYICKTESPFLRLAGKHAEVHETKSQPYGSAYFERPGFIRDVLIMG